MPNWARRRGAARRRVQRHHVEAFLAWNRTRPWRGRVARPRPVAASVVHATVLAVRNFFDDLALWGWAEQPARQLVFPGHVPRPAATRLLQDFAASCSPRPTDPPAHPVTTVA